MTNDEKSKDVNHPPPDESAADMTKLAMRELWREGIITEESLDCRPDSREAKGAQLAPSATEWDGAPGAQRVRD